MHALAIDPDQYPKMNALADLLTKLDRYGGHIAKDNLDALVGYLSDHCAPPPETFDDCYMIVKVWLHAYAQMYGDVLLKHTPEPNAPGVDTPQ